MARTGPTACHTTIFSAGRRSANCALISAIDSSSMADSAMKISCGNDSNLLMVFYVQIMPDDFVMQLHRF
ncbi:hypothetical protein AM398_11995 [Escherichia coli]|nr:hypothetical protein AM396_16645 [Escherichia coli]ARX32378.1 hypothetical protein AM398_11995 [Escherichia coli]ARZ90979.1 hypothetical protein AM397_24820 [Escherichia coli]